MAPTVTQIVQRGLYVEEFEVGAVYLHRPGRTPLPRSLRLPAACAAAEAGSDARLVLPVDRAGSERR